MSSSNNEIPSESNLLHSLRMKLQESHQTNGGQAASMENGMSSMVKQQTEGPKGGMISKLTTSQLIAAAGATSGLLAGVVVCPLDVVKTRAQAHTKLSNGHDATKVRIVDAFKSILREDGPKGLYRGLVPITIGYLPTWMIYFTVYERAKGFYAKLTHRFHIESNFLDHFCSAVTAGMSSSIAVNPIWVVKTRLMVQTRKDPARSALDPSTFKRTYYNGTFDAFRKMYKEEGIKVFYSGLVPSLFGLLHVGIQFPVYEKLRVMVHYDPKTDTSSLSMLKLIFSSCMSKMIASSVTYPHEIVRTILQVQSSSNPKSSNKGKKEGKMLDSIASIYHKEGLRGFYAGYFVNLLRTVPASAVTLVSFEYIKTFLLDWSGKT